jgi:putative spermidine/putrescine transport system permease protein
MKRIPIWSWIIFIIGMLYFFIPLISVFEFSLRKIRGIYSFAAYQAAFTDPEFYRNFGMSLMWALLTIVVSLVLIVPTAYWVHYRMPRWRPIVEFFPDAFVVPAVVLVFGMARLYLDQLYG